MTRPRRPTSADVAEAAGVSRATVSYVLNRNPNQAIPEATRQRVLAAAAQLGYTPSAAAKALRSGRSDLVLYLLPDWPIGDSAGRMIEQVSAALAARGLTCVVHPLAGNDRPLAELWKALSPDAVVTFDPLPEPDVAVMRSAGITVVVALAGEGASGPEPLADADRRTGRLQVEHLAGSGHERLGYAYPDDARVAGFAQARLEGVRKACAELGRPEPVVRPMSPEVEDGAGAIAAWRAAGVTAVCAYNDELGLAVLAGLHRLGLAAPGDLAVIGVDDVPAARLAVPPLSSVRLDLGVMARHLADRITADLAGEPPTDAPVARLHTVVVRESS